MVIEENDAGKSTASKENKDEKNQTTWDKFRYSS